MIVLNSGYRHLLVGQESFGDGTLKCSKIPDELFYDDEIEILWNYDNDSELFCLWVLVSEIKEFRPETRISLNLPYLPHARQDRHVSNRLFTLKAFAKIINAMNFTSVTVLDPHSDVSAALIDRLRYYSPISLDKKFGDFSMMFPDAGAAKKYSAECIHPIIGNKHRNAEGRIDKYELLNFIDGTKYVLIRDDICSYGGTFVAAAKELRARGVEKIVLVVSHCENNILKGDVFDWIDEVYTTDSICTVEHPKIHFLRQYRKCREKQNV